MPFTVITLKKVPNSLRGDLTRWMQEIATGVYVGSYNSKVREYLWKRVTDTVGQGEAAMCYSCRNEIGYSFCTYNTERQVIDYDGIPLVLIPAENVPENAPKTIPDGFSKAYKYHKAVRKVTSQNASKLQGSSGDDRDSGSLNPSVKFKSEIADKVFLDIETTGLDADHDEIIEIGAVKVAGDKETEFHRLICTGIKIPDAVRNLTGITCEMLKNGSPLEESIWDLYAFIQDSVLVGYNLSFDLRFLNRALAKLSLGPIHNQTIDLIREAKKRNSFQTNYKFETTLKEYGIDQTVPHRALEDAKLMRELYHLMGLSKN